MATRLSQVVAVEKGVKTSTHQAITQAYQLLQKQALLSGISRTYRPRDEGGEQLPPEYTPVQVKAGMVVERFQAALSNLLDLTLQKDTSNLSAIANVKIDGQTVLADVPVTYLLFLEKQLIDVHTFVSKLPVLDAAKTWTYDENQGCRVSDPVETVRSKKVPRNHEKAPATDRHPAQVEMWFEDIAVGYWKTVNTSGALPADTIRSILSRVEEVQRAIKFAREEANTVEAAPKVRAGDAILGYIFATDSP